MKGDNLIAELCRIPTAKFPDRKHLFLSFCKFTSKSHFTRQYFYTSQTVVSSIIDLFSLLHLYSKCKTEEEMQWKESQNHAVKSAPKTVHLDSKINHEQWNTYSKYNLEKKHRFMFLQVIRELFFPLGAVGRPGPPLQCGLKGGNPLARTLDIGNPHDVAEFGEYSWMAAILRLDLTYVCGAVLIDINVVLTAAHCVAKYTNQQCFKSSNKLIISHSADQSMHRKIIFCRCVVCLNLFSFAFQSKRRRNNRAIGRVRRGWAAGTALSRHPCTQRGHQRRISQRNFAERHCHFNSGRAGSAQQLHPTSLSASAARYVGSGVYRDGMGSQSST